jgi:cell division protein FtsB
MKFRFNIRQLKPHITLNNGVVILALLVASGWVWNTIEAIQRNFELQQQVDSLKQEIAVYELRNKTIEFQNKYYSSDEYLELSARERLNKAASGEKLLVLPANTVKTKAETTEVASETPITKRSNFEQWMYFLFGDKT